MFPASWSKRPTFPQIQLEGFRKERDMDGVKLYEESRDKGYRKVKGRDFLGFPLRPKKCEPLSYIIPYVSEVFSTVAHGMPRCKNRMKKWTSAESHWVLLLPYSIIQESTKCPNSWHGFANSGVRVRFFTYYNWKNFLKIIQSVDFAKREIPVNNLSKKTQKCDMLSGRMNCFTNIYYRNAQAWSIKTLGNIQNICWYGKVNKLYVHVFAKHLLC